MTTTNFNNWPWPKLKPTNLLKSTNLNFTFGVLLISWCFFSCRAAKWGWAGVPASVSLRGGAGGPSPSWPNQHIFWQQGNVRQCHEIRPSSKNKVRWCENFLVILKSIFGHFYSIMLTGLIKIDKKFSSLFSMSKWVLCEDLESRQLSDLNFFFNGIIFLNFKILIDIITLNCVAAGTPTITTILILYRVMKVKNRHADFA